MTMRVAAIVTVLIAGTVQAQLGNQFGGTVSNNGGQAGIPYSSIGDYGTASTSQPGATGGLVPTWDEARLSHYHQTLLTLRKEALRLRAEDGGHLEATHDTFIQAKIDAAGRPLHSELSPRAAAAFAAKPH